MNENSNYAGGREYNTFHKFYTEINHIDNFSSTENINLRDDLPRNNHSQVENFKYYSVDKFNDTVKDNNSALSTISINVRGIERNFDNLLLFMKSITHEFDIIALTECHIHLNETYNSDLHNTHSIPGYDKFYVQSKIRYGGVVLYVRANLKATYCLELTGSHDNHDCVYVKINPEQLHDKKYIKNRRPLKVGAYYRHCRKTGIMPFIADFAAEITHKVLKKSDIIVAGDFNICLMKSTTNTDSILFLNTILANNYEIHILKPTRIQYYKDSLQVRSATLIDLIISNLVQYDCISGNIAYPDSDHHATFTIFESYKSHSYAHSQKEKRKIRRLNCIDKTILTADFSKYDWDTLVFSEPNLDLATNNLSQAIEELCDKHAPLIEPSNKMLKHMDKPWIDSTLLKLIQEKNQAHANKTNIPTEQNKNLYSALNRKATSYKRKKKKQYFKDYFTKFRYDSKKLWNGINTALEQSKSKQALPTSIRNTDGSNVEGDSNIARSFAQYFESVPGKTKNKIPPYKHPYMHYVKKRKEVNDYLVLNETNTEEVYKYICKLKNNSSSGPSTVPNRFIKLLGEPLATVLTHIINRSMNSGHVPSSMKVGKQTPVHKGGELCISNYRPITVCSSIAKILEKVVRDRVIKYIDRAKILNKSQFGFRSKHSTNHAIINLTESTLDALENGLKVGGVYLDIAKAFDTVNHDILLRKLEYYGFRANTLMWFESYLKNRKQYVTVRDQNSNQYELKWGIPQGGTIAPVLFILFMNDITQCSQIFDFSIYADDTCLILGIRSECYSETMKSELQNVVDWFSSNELLLNFGKTDYLNFGPHYRKVYEKGECDMTDLHATAPQYVFVEPWDEEEDPTFHELNKKGEFVMHDLHKIAPKFLIEEFIEMPDESLIYEPESVKYLGVHFDNRFEFKKHIDILNCKISRLVGILWKCEYLSLEAKQMVYSGLVEAHLNYGIVTWASAFAKNISSTQVSDHVPSCLQQTAKIQNMIIRAIFRKPRYNKDTRTNTSMAPLYKELNALKLCDLYYYNLAMLGHDYFHSNTLPEKLALKLNRQYNAVTDRTTRNSKLNLQYKTPSNNLMQRRPTTAISAYWNFLPAEIKSCKSKSTFKVKMKKFLLSAY